MFNPDTSRQTLEKEVRAALASRFPIERKTGKGDAQDVYTVDVANITFEYPDTSYRRQAEAFVEEQTLEGVVKADVEVKKNGKPFHKLKQSTLSVFPVPTERGTYIINGNETVFLHQMLRRPGIYAKPTKVESGDATREVVVGEVNTTRGRYRLEVDRKNGRLTAPGLNLEYGAKGASVDGISFLRMLGATDDEIRRACGMDETGKVIYETFMAKAKPMDVSQIHEKTHVRPYESDEETVARVKDLLGQQTFDAHSRRINEISTGTAVDKVDKTAFLAALTAMVNEIRPDRESPSLDDPRFKTVLVPEAVIARSIEKGIGDWMNKMNTTLFRSKMNGDPKKEKEAFRPSTHVTKAVRGLYNGSLAEAVDSGNPLDLHQKLRKVTSLGDFGLSSNAVSLSNRNLYPGMFGKVDPVETPQSFSMGVVEHLARDAEVKDGLVYSKFHRVRDGVVDASKVVDDIDPLDEYDEVIAFNDPDAYVRDGKKWTLKPGKVRARTGGRFVEVDRKRVTLIDRSPVSHLSYATGLIPFAANNDGARLLMGASMQKQALPVTGAEAPIVQADAQLDGRTADMELADNISHNLKAPVAGTVTEVGDDHITIKAGDGTEHQVERLNYFSTGKNSGYIHHKPVVAAGDRVKVGELLADGWHSKGGEFALGKNTLVAYMPYEGLNFEDGVVVSESFARKMTSEEVKVDTYTIPLDAVAANQPLARNGATYTVDGLLARESKLTDEQAGKLDKRGIIKKGAVFGPGDTLVAAFTDTSTIEDEDVRLSQKKRHGSFAFKPHRASGYMKGKVVDVHVSKTDDGQKVSIKYVTEKPMEKGDKLSGRHGNKGTISDIIPDEKMPRVGGPDGEPVELIFSPLAVPSRKNLGQLYEVHAGMLAKTTGQDRYVMKSFDRSERERLLKGMEEAGMGDGKFELYNPTNGKTFEQKVTVGPMYVMKLKHKVENKVTRRSTDRVGRTVDYMTNMPKKISGSVDGDRRSPQAIGGMEFWSLTSAGAVENIHEMTTLKSDGINRERGRIDLYDAIATGRPLPRPATPETLKNLQDYLYGAGIRMTAMDGDKPRTLDDTFTSLMLSPNKAKDDAFKGLPEVYTSKLDRVTSRIDQSDLKHALGKAEKETTRNRKGEEVARGGLYDSEIFGDAADQWGKITLAAPVANPIFLKGNNAYQALLYKKGYKNGEVDRLAKGELFHVFDPAGMPGLSAGDLVDGKTLDDLMLEHEKKIDAKTGGEALERLLREVDLSSTYDAIHADLVAAKDAQARTKLVNQARVVSHAIDRGFKPEDYVLRTVPVMPLKYRPSIRGQGNTVSHDDLTKLYQRVIEDNVKHGQAFSGWKKELGKHDIDRDDAKMPVVHQDAVPELVLHENQSESAAALYKRVEDLVGTKAPAQSGITKPGTRKTEEDLKGILDRLSSKKGFLREKMQKKSQDFSGRSVIVVDPTLDLDEVSLPEDMVKEMFEPHIIRELGKMGLGGPSSVRKHLEAGDSFYREATMRVLKDNPVILNRAPSLHKHSLQAFDVAKVSWNNGDGSESGRASRAIGLNPVVTTPFNADFDGDTMSVHVPLSPEAKREARELLMPSKNLVNPTNNSMIMELKHEMQLGIFYSTRDRIPTGQQMRFKSFKELEEAYRDGEVKTYQAVLMNVREQGVVLSTAGKHLFNGALAEARVPKEFVDYEANVDMDAKKMRALLEKVLAHPKGGSMVVTRAINNLRRVGFKTATHSGMSIGIRDFDALAKVDKKRLLNDAKTDKAFQARLKKDDPALYKAVYENPVALHAKQLEAFEQAKSNFVLNELKGMVDSKGGKASILGADNPVSVMMQSGARGNAGQVVGMAGMVGVGKDVENKATAPVDASLMEGLRPDEFFTMSADSRKGIFDKSIATQDPGALTRQIWFANRHMVVSEADCGDKTGVKLRLLKEKGIPGDDLRHLRGRVLLEPIKLDNGVVRPTGVPIPMRDLDRVRTAARSNKLAQETVKVRSPLTCKSTQGVCQKCYGARPGGIDNEFVPIGEAVGSIAAQALGEPSQQAIMRTFHSGAGQSSTTNAFEQIRNVLELSSTAKPNTAVVTDVAGTVTKIERHPFTGTTVHVNGKAYKLGSLPVNPELREGMRVDVCEPLTDPRSTHVNPRDVLRLKGEGAAQSYLIDTVSEAFKMGNIDDTDRRHLELTVGVMTDRAVITDPGTTGLLPGQTVRKHTVEEMNRKIKRDAAYDAPLTHQNMNQVIGKHLAKDVKALKGGRIIGRKGQAIDQRIWQDLRAEGRSYIAVTDAAPATFDAQLFGVQNDTKMADGQWLGNAAFRNSKSHLLMGAAIGSRDTLSDPLTAQMTGKKGDFGRNFNAFVEEAKERFGGLF